MIRRLLAAAGVATIGLWAAAGPALAGEPDPGHADLYQHDPGDARITLDWHFASSSYATWFRTNVEAELETYWDDPVANNSNVPRYDNGGDNSGGGTITYTSASASPCTGSTVWIACNPAGGLRAFDLYVRAMPSISATTWMWYQRDNTCQDLYDGSPNPNDGFPTTSCFSVLRVVAHESTHNTLVRAHYDAGLEDETIMQSTTPTAKGSPDFWNRKNFLPCDLAAAQLEYGPADAAGRYADCFAVTPGDGVKGLNSALTVTSGSSYARCWNTSATISGRLALAASAAYEDMRNWPLSGRTIRIDRRPVGATTWTTGSASATATGAGGANWKAVLTTSTAGSFEYRATFFTSSSEPAVNSSNAVTWTVQWTSAGCPT
jgi:hypothetical protein